MTPEQTKELITKAKAMFNIPDAILDIWIEMFECLNDYNWHKKTLTDLYTSKDETQRTDHSTIASIIKNRITDELLHRRKAEPENPKEYYRPTGSITMVEVGRYWIHQLYNSDIRLSKLEESMLYSDAHRIPFDEAQLKHFADCKAELELRQAQPVQTTKTFIDEIVLNKSKTAAKASIPASDDPVLPDGSFEAWMKNDDKIKTENPLSPRKFNNNQQESED